jgi:hypothetical protein
MEFNTLVKSKLYPILQKYGYIISEETKNIIRFKSDTTKINIVSDDHDKTHLIEIGKQVGILYPLHDKGVRNIFSFELAIENVSLNTFIKNLAFLFEQPKGIEILKGNIKPLVDEIERESSSYTSELLQKQVLEMASKAWGRKDYKTFVKSIDELGVEKVPKSFQAKYKIARQSENEADRNN